MVNWPAKSPPPTSQPSISAPTSPLPQISHPKLKPASYSNSTTKSTSSNPPSKNCLVSTSSLSAPTAEEAAVAAAHPRMKHPPAPLPAKTSASVFTPRNPEPQQRYPKHGWKATPAIPGPQKPTQNLHQTTRSSA